MREFKFRIWDENKKEFISEDESVTIRANDGSVDAYPRYEDGFIIQQFTGLLDKNKKEIYEGDILRADEWVFNPKTEEHKIYRENAICHIWYANPCPHIAEWAVSFNHLYSESSCEFKNLRNVEIIGNIFESPELLS